MVALREAELRITLDELALEAWLHWVQIAGQADWVAWTCSLSLRVQVHHICSARFFGLHFYDVHPVSLTCNPLHNVLHLRNDSNLKVSWVFPDSFRSHQCLNFHLFLSNLSSTTFYCGPINTGPPMSPIHPKFLGSSHLNTLKALLDTR